MEEKRLDVYLHENGYADSREKAKRLITENCVYLNQELISKPSAKVNENDLISVTDTYKYVGRGASKLEKAIISFNLTVKDAVAVDIGASTGGFTDYLLQNGAKKIYAIDVGYGQLHEKLKNDFRVVNLEKTNFRYINSEIFKEKIDLIAADVSFISLKLIMPKIVEISHKNTNIVFLVKPQFEAGKNYIGKNGIVKDKKVHLTVLKNFGENCLTNNLYIENITFSPIKGGDGNIEYLAYLKKGNLIKYDNEQFKSLINEAFDIL